MLIDIDRTTKRQLSMYAYIRMMFWCAYHKDQSSRVYIYALRYVVLEYCPYRTNSKTASPVVRSVCTLTRDPGAGRNEGCCIQFPIWAATSSQLVHVGA